MPPKRLLDQSGPAGRRRVLLALSWYSIAIHRGITRFAHDAHWIVDGGFVRAGFIPSDWRGDGIIAVLGVHPGVDAAVARLGVPTVNIGYEHQPGIPSVAADSGAIGRLAAEHFLTRGFRSFAFYESTRGRGEILRRDGFEQTLKAHGYPVSRLGLSAAHDAGQTITDEPEEILVGRQLSALKMPVAVLAEYDDRAVRVIDSALAAGLRVPEQVAILGVDNDELRCPFAPVPLSSIDNDEERIGVEAARQLRRLMDGQLAPAEPLLIQPRRVVVRQSTNILAIPHEHVASALRMIWEHYTEPIDATRVAAEVSLSYTQLHEAFVKHVGHSMAEEIERRRIEHAQRLLSHGELKLAVVARKSGFGSADRMGRVFSRKLNTTPSDYRQQVLEGTHATVAPQDRDDGEARPAAFDEIESL